MNCKENYEFVVLEELGHIEIRHKNGTFVSSVCCRECVGELENAIKRLKNSNNKQ